jgi:dynein heavy chain
LDYSHWYDRTKLTLKEIHNTQYVSCMNPTAGSFTINSRLQRHFCVFALSFPGLDALATIYNSILSQHLAQNQFPVAVQKISSNVVNAALALHQKISQTFLPTAIKFHYIFNLRDLSNIFQVQHPYNSIEYWIFNHSVFVQGILFATPDCCKEPPKLVRLWIHEAMRVYKDKMVEPSDAETFDKVIKDSVKKSFEVGIMSDLIAWSYADSIIAGHG